MSLVEFLKQNHPEALVKQAATAETKTKTNGDLILMRGLPGSGKTTFAQQLLEQGKKEGRNPVNFSTDDFFLVPLSDESKSVTYKVRTLFNLAQKHKCFVVKYDVTKLRLYHLQNQGKARKAMKERTHDTVIIDNCNAQLWEMKPYVEMAMTEKYKVAFVYPPTEWSMDAEKCALASTHGVPLEIGRAHV